MSAFKDLCYEVNNIWEKIGGDYLTALEEQGKAASIPRRDVADLILDNLHHGPKELQTYIDSIEDFDAKMGQVEGCLRYETYGW